MFWWKPYEALMEHKAVTGDVALVELLSKELVEFLEGFPPGEDAVEWTNAGFADRFKGRLAELPTLDARFVGILLEIVRLDLDHETERIDWLLRNGHHRDACPTPLHEDALKLLWPVLVEHLYSRKEECQDILKRRHLLDICSQADERFRRRALRGPTVH